MVSRFLIGMLVCFCCLQEAVLAQTPVEFKASVASTEVHLYSPFYVTFEASVPRRIDIVFPSLVGLEVEGGRPKTTKSSVIHSTPNGLQRQDTIQYSYVVRAMQMGEIVIPSVEVTINGQILRTEPITLTVLDEDPAIKYPVHLWVSRTTVKKGQWFWIYIEAQQLDRLLPNQLAIEGVENAPFLPENLIEVLPYRSATQKQVRGYRVKATSAGTIKIPQMDFLANGRAVSSNPLTVTVLDAPSTATNSIEKAPAPRIYKGSIQRLESGFVTLDVDTREVFLGEPIVLTKQLWKVLDRLHSLGSRRGSSNIPSTTEGFYVSPLDPIQFVAYHGGIAYTVMEERKVLYPTTTGDLSIGEFKFDGDIISNRKISDYTVEHGPYTIKVKPAPVSPPGFKGAVGQFAVESTLEATALKAGVPVRYTITIRGEGNPDAIGAPALPTLNWAHVSEPERNEIAHVTFGQLLTGVKKTFTYTITPTDAGKQTLPTFDYATYNPDTQAYEIKSFSAVNVTVKPGDDDSAAVLISNEQGGVIATPLLASGEIHPMLPAPNSMARAQRGSRWVYGLFLLPIVVFGLVSTRMKHVHRMDGDLGYARAHDAKEKSIQRLKKVLKATEPTDELYRAVVEYIGNIFNVSEQGMTSSDVKSVLEEHGVDAPVCTTLTRLLKSCERARYAGQELSHDELRALVQAAEAALNVVDEHTRNGGGR